MTRCSVVAFEVDIEGFVPVFSGLNASIGSAMPALEQKQINSPFMRQHIVNQRFNTVFRLNIICQKAIGLRQLRHFQIRTDDRRAFGTKLICSSHDLT